MKNDFLLHKSKVLEVFQKEFGTALIKDIIILWISDWAKYCQIHLSLNPDQMIWLNQKTV